MILAIDPGIATCGWAIVVPSNGEIVELGAIISPHDADVDESTDRARRLATQAATWRDLAHRHKITAIAAEAVSLGGPPKARLSMGMCLSLSWGALVQLAIELGVSLLEIRPKLWMGAIQEGARRINYDDLFEAVCDYIEAAPWGAPVLAMLRAIAKAHQNHAADAGGIGVFASLRPHRANVIVERRTLHVEHERQTA